MGRNTLLKIRNIVKTNVFIFNPCDSEIGLVNLTIFYTMSPNKKLVSAEVKMMTY